jgi:hypothetical protein
LCQFVGTLMQLVGWGVIGGKVAERIEGVDDLPYRVCGCMPLCMEEVMDLASTLEGV